jgi:hypothetical protein
VLYDLSEIHTQRLRNYAMLAKRSIPKAKCGDKYLKYNNQQSTLIVWCIFIYNMFTNFIIFSLVASQIAIYLLYLFLTKIETASLVLFSLETQL